MIAADLLHVESLTSRERQVAHAVTLGLRNRAIARQFGISEETVKKHLGNIYGKLAVDGRVQLTIQLLRGQVLQCDIGQPRLPMSHCKT